jgi:hypothetical protein
MLLRLLISFHIAMDISIHLFDYTKKHPFYYEPKRSLIDTAEIKQETNHVYDSGDQAHP